MFPRWFNPAHKPIKPSAPPKPKETSAGYLYLDYLSADRYSLRQLVDMAEKAGHTINLPQDLDKLFINIESSWDDSYASLNIATTEPNHQYERQHKAYLKKMEKYEAKLKIYQDRLKEWESLKEKHDDEVQKRLFDQAKKTYNKYRAKFEKEL